MGYSEVLCHICGVSFNISRYRTAHEPRSSAWHNDGGGTYPFIEVFDWEEDKCPKGSGCLLVNRSSLVPDPPNATSEIRSSNGATNPDKGFHEQVVYEADSDNRDKAWFNGKYELEHIAGPGCVAKGGYSGHRISAAAMEGCNTFQCLVRKHKDWEPEDDDEDFEDTLDWSLSGLGDQMWSRDYWGEGFCFPERHQCDSPLAENVAWHLDQAFEYAIPFHPTCFEVLKRTMLRRWGEVDVEAFIQWWALEATFDKFRGFPREDAVEEAQQQWWEHRAGDEYLVANPCFVPGLEEILTTSQFDEGAFRSEREFAFPDMVEIWKGHDPFLRLPNELRIMIALESGSKDIANLRLVSRAFRQLPQSLFMELTLREMPWLYEAVTDEPLSFWASTTAKEMRDKSRRYNRRWMRLRAVQRRLDGSELSESSEEDGGRGEVEEEEGSHDESQDDEEMGGTQDREGDEGENRDDVGSEDEVEDEDEGDSDDSGRHTPTSSSASSSSNASISSNVETVTRQISNILAEARARPPVPVTYLPARETNWYRLRTELARHKAQLLGLKNRARIWKDCEEILDRIERYRALGRIFPGKVADPTDVMELDEEERRTLEPGRRWRPMRD